MKHLIVGMAAPPFEAVDHTGKRVSLKDFRGKKVILYFYPKDDTPGCTAEACNLRDNHTLLLEKGFVVLGVSPDKQDSHLKFSKKYELPFPLIPDSDKSIINAYGVWGPKKFMGRQYDGVHRTTFVISEEGNILHIFDKVETKTHAQQILNAIESK